MTIYRSPAGRHRLDACYETALDRLSVDVDERAVETRHGSTHVLLAGPNDGEPVLVFHGGNATNPMTLSWYTGLADEYRLLAPDTIGQPGRSAETRFDPRGDGYGEWVVDLLDAFELESAPMIGTSYGGGIVLRTAALAPERIDRAALVAPAGFGTGSLVSMARIGVLGLCYRYLPRAWFLDRLLGAIATEPGSDDAVRETVGASLRYLDLEREFPGADAVELAGFDAPVALFLGEDDPLIPPETIVPRARERLSGLDRVEVLAGEKHLLSRSAQERVTASIREFFEPA